MNLIVQNHYSTMKIIAMRYKKLLGVNYQKLILSPKIYIELLWNMHIRTDIYNYTINIYSYYLHPHNTNPIPLLLPPLPLHQSPNLLSDYIIMSPHLCPISRLKNTITDSISTPQLMDLPVPKTPLTRLQTHHRFSLLSMSKGYRCQRVGPVGQVSPWWCI